MFFGLPPRGESFRCATCAIACTPASVRPAPPISTWRLKKSSAALRNSPVTVRAFDCSCHPLYRVPSYSRVSFHVRIELPRVNDQSCDSIRTTEPGHILFNDDKTLGMNGIKSSKRLLFA